MHDTGDEGAHDPLAAAIGAIDPHAKAPLAEGDAGGRAITAFLVGLKSRGQALSMQREVNQFAAEPLSAILPGATLLEVWEIVGAAEQTLLAVSVLVAVVVFAGMLVTLLTSLSERRREMAVLRALGARPVHVFGLIVGEAALLTLAGIVAGLAALYLGLLAGRPWLESRLGLFVSAGAPSAHELALVLMFESAGLLIGLIPAYRIYRYSLADGMTIRV
jgi:putative ABC transport system permease protein